MSRIVHVALRDFLATVMTKGFIIGLLVAPAIGGVMILVGPWLFDDSRYQIEGDYAVLDPTGAVLPAMSAALDPAAVAERRMNEFRRTLGDAPEAVRGLAEAAIRESMDDALGGHAGWFEASLLKRAHEVTDGTSRDTSIHQDIEIR